ncbi:NAD(P)-binding protein [Marinomonas rhizomae]|uniref:NAD(P)/FAD-dependent oxidoreductase n=1 Tax=Marinomonas rhizomae TaxID=491948 RepID=UPI00210798FF|nr:FAD-dependent oxidoreductase [Marinomonas rhizomae]UTW00505.1 NAD(P)-binding protein [Marinomonas rhizomae]
MNTLTASQVHTPTFDIAIIGAGLAGSLCAHLLSQSGQSVCIIDKSRGSGGRASSKRLDGDISCDLGTPYVVAKHPDTLALFAQLMEEHIVAPWKQLSNMGSQAFVGVPKMSAITRHWIQNAKFITSTRIHHLDQISQQGDDQSSWLLRDDKYQPVVIAKKIIVAAPAPQAASILASHDNLAVLLLRANQASASYLSQWAMWLETEQCDLNALIEPKNSLIKRMIKDNYKPMRHNEKVDRWVIQTEPNWTKQNLDSDKEWISQTLLQAFAEITEHRVLKHGEPHRWFLSRFTENKGNKCFVWSPEHNVGLAGDWLCQGDAEGALLSALSLVNHMKDSE